MGESQQPFAESSLAKARKYLNALVVKAWKELDDKLIGCKEFEDKNRVTFKQVMTQIATLAGDLADLAKIKAQATEMINVKEQELITTKAMLKKETDAYMKIYLANKAEMKIRKDDLAVFSFMLKLVACKKGAAFAQVGRDAKICDDSGGLELRFDGVEERCGLRAGRQGREKLRCLWRPRASLRRRGVAGGVRAQDDAICPGSGPRDPRDYRRGKSGRDSH